MSRSARMRIFRIWVAGLVALGGWNLAEMKWAHAQDSEDPVAFLSGRRLDQALGLPVTVTWSQASLRERMQGFGRTQRVALFLDRNVDPQREVNFAAQGLTTPQFLWRLASSLELAVVRVEDLYYLGPADSVATLPLILDQLGRETLMRRRQHEVNWLARAPLQTDPVVEPKRLLEQLADEAGVELVGLETLPHDVWAGFSIPETSLQGRFQLLLHGFGKTFQRDSAGRQATIVDLPQWTMAHRDLTDLDLGEREDQLLREVPGLDVQVRGKRIRLKGTPQQLLAAEAFLVGQQAAAGNMEGEKRFTLTTTAQRGSILAEVARQTGTRLSFEAHQQERLGERVTLDVQNIPLEELLDKVLAGTGLSARLEAGQLRVLGD